MDEFYDEITTQPGTDFEPAGNRHYIATDAQSRITSAWSDGPHRDRDTTNAICINDQGGYQFRLSPGGEENPALYTEDGIPLYKWDGEQVIPRTEEEMEADRLPSLKAAKLAELSAACNAAVTAGCDVVLSDGSADSAMAASSGHAQYTGHISLTAEDQINLTNACASVEAGAEAYPYHLDGQLCALYPADDILAMAQAATAHKLYHTTYFNHLAVWVRRCESVDEVSAITYGAELPEDLAENMSAILTAAGGNADKDGGEPDAV